MILVRIVKDWDWPDIMRQTPGQTGIWGDVRFTIAPVPECDYVIVLNNRMKVDTPVACPREHIWAIMQEPYYRGFTDWVVEKHETYAKVFTHQRAAYGDDKHVPSQPALPWHVNKTYDELIVAAVPDKSKNLSWIVGNALDLPGHLQRWSFLEFLKKDPALGLDLYGKKIRYIEDKWDGLAPYRYSLAVENTSGPDYWTEKIADCFLAWTVPLYCGCTNLEDYFPGESFIRVDIGKPDESLAEIKRILREDDWERRIPALKQARELVLNRYQLFPFAAGLIHSQHSPGGEKRPVTIPAYRRSAKAVLDHRLYRLKKQFGRL
jgi:hypothetical protein